MERHIDTNTFGDDIRRDIGRPKRSLLVIYCCYNKFAKLSVFFSSYPVLINVCTNFTNTLQVVVFWSFLLVVAIVKLFALFPFSWGEVVFCVVFLSLVTILMQILIAFSQSENSTPPKASEPDPDQLKQVLLQS